MDQQTIEMLKVVVAPICVLLAAMAGSYFASKNTRYLKKHELLLRQIDEFYSPILGYWMDIESKVKLRLEFDEEFKKAWKEICDKAGNRLDWDSKKAFEKFMNNIIFHNEQFSDEILPFYQEILNIYREKVWLLKLDHRQQLSGIYYKLHMFLEIWKMVHKKAMPREVGQKINHGIGCVRPFILKIEEQRERIILELLKSSYWYRIKRFLSFKRRRRHQLKEKWPLNLEE
ncbi:hypothetical protein ACFL27_16705 [candidate division CSSED10-310 bacterium]|uniref:DUF4760 domain-containing protein n=1 Tax=candidate division CSSED10-310 bacterium TaxID=2855610 RepID=A0ABV6Z0H1_UNCC1